MSNLGIMSPHPAPPPVPAHIRFMPVAGSWFIQQHSHADSVRSQAARVMVSFHPASAVGYQQLPIYGVFHISWQNLKLGYCMPPPDEVTVMD